VTIDAGTTWRARLLNGGYARVGTSTTTGRVGQVLSQIGASVSTTSAVEVSLATFSLPANSLAVNGQMVRVFAHGVLTTGTGSGAILVKFGATTVATGAIVNNTAFRLEAEIVRYGATAQRSSGFVIGATTIVGHTEQVPAETLSGAVTIDVRGNIGGGASSLVLESFQVEYLAK